MAAEPTRIKLKRSTTATVVPTTSNITDGEVALNIADRKLYVNNAGTIVEIANQKPNTGEVTTSMLATDITNGPGNIWYVAKNGADTTTLGNGGAGGKHQDTAFLTVAKALTVAQAGDQIVISPGVYQETAPLTVPDNVSIKGSDQRTTIIENTAATEDEHLLVLEGDTRVSDLQLRGWKSPKYGITVASNTNNTQVPVVERCTFFPKGSPTSASDPYGYDATGTNKAGGGAYLDGALWSSSTGTLGFVFNECTFITPNNIGVTATNGMRVEMADCYFYFNSNSIKTLEGATGIYGTGKARLKLNGVSGTFASSEIIYQLEDTFKSGTYSRTGNTVTVTNTNHGLTTADVIYADAITGSASDNYYAVTVVDANSFTFTDAASGSTTGNITYKKAEAYGTIDSNDGTYIFLNGKGTGLFSTGVATPVAAVTNGDAQLDTAQKKFGSASLLLDGTGDYLNVPTDADLGLGTTNFCIEAFIRPSSVSGTQTIIDLRSGSATDTAPVLYLDGTTLHYKVGNTSQASGGTLATGTWYHVAVARSGGSTKLFLDGTQVGSTYTDGNDYGSTKPLIIGGDYNSGANEFAGHIDELRISKGAGRFTGNFTPTTGEYSSDLNTVVLYHFNGDDASTSTTNSGKGIKDIRSNGGDSASSVATSDYSQFGAEVHASGCSSVYGVKGVTSDGRGTIVNLTGHSFQYIGSGKDSTNDPDLAVQANEVEELNDGKVYYESVDQEGDYRIGSALTVNQRTGSVNFTSQSTTSTAASITLSDATGTTNIFPAYVQTGNLRLSGNTLSSTSGAIIVDPASNEDITLNAEIISPEKLYFDANKYTSIDSTVDGSLSFRVEGNEQAGFSSYGLFTNKNLTVFSLGIATVNIVSEGSELAGFEQQFTAVSNPNNVATATAALVTGGTLNSITLSNPGSGYIAPPDIVIAAPGGSGTEATATAQLKTNSGKVVGLVIGNSGTGYVSPTITIAAPNENTFDIISAVNSSTDAITIASHPFVVGDEVVYSNGGGSINIGLTSGTTYFVVAATTDTIKLGATSGGAVINLTAGGSSELHSITGKQATATITQSSGELQPPTITEAGNGYSTTPIVTITDSGGSAGDIQATLGFRLEGFAIGAIGSGYTSTPSVTINPTAGDSTGTGAVGTAVLGYAIDAVTVTNPGRGYSILPTIKIDGGNPTTDAQLTPVFNKKSGTITGITVTGGGDGYTTAPTLTLLGGAGSDAKLDLKVLPLSGTITNGGSGYAPGTYTGVALLGGGVITQATATLTVVGLTGTLTAGSGYTANSYAGVKVRNNPTSTFAVTNADRAYIPFRYSDSDDQAYEVSTTGGSNTDYTFTRTSSVGTASGDDISFAVEKGDKLTLTMTATASSHPLWIQKVSGAYQASEALGTIDGVTNNGATTGDIIWDLTNTEPGTYYYVCANHAAMGGTIVVSAYSGATFSVGQTVTGGTSGASGTISFLGENFLRIATVTSGPFQINETLTTSATTATSTAAESTESVFFIGGTESPATALLSYNSYNFDLSDSSLDGKSFSITSTNPSALEFEQVGVPGQANAVGYLVVKSTWTSADTIQYGSVPQSGNNFTVSTGVGSQGVFGYGATATVVVGAAGTATSWTFTNQGTGYKATDVVTANVTELGNTGSGVSYTINADDRSVSSVTNISTTGGPYSVGDVLTVDAAFDTAGNGSGFQYTVTKAGYLDSVVVAEAGFGFFANDTLLLIDTPPLRLETTGTAIAIQVATVSDITPIELGYDGSATSQLWAIDKDGNTTFKNINGSGSISLTGGITSGGTITTTGAVSSATLNVQTSASITDLTTNGNSIISSATISLADGTATAPSFKLASNTQTGYFRAGANSIGLTVSGVQKGYVGPTATLQTLDFQVDSDVASLNPFLKVDATNESVTIGAPETQIKINNDGLIETVGTDLNVDLKVSPKGQGNFTIIGGADQDFNILDSAGGTEVFKIDTATGDATFSGNLDAGLLRVRDNVIANNSTLGVKSFGEVLAVSVTGSGSGYTDGTYTATATTSSGDGTGCTVTVTVASGDFSAVTIVAKGQNYRIGETLTITAAGGGTGRTIAITDIDGTGVVLKPGAGKDILCDTTGSFVVPAGTTNERPVADNRRAGAIRYNTTQLQFEGYNGSDFVSLGGVRDVDQDTYVLTESSPGADEDTFEFFNQGVNSISLSQTKFTLRTAKTFDVAGTATFNGTAAGDPLAVTFSGASILQVRSKKDIEIASGFRLRGVPVQGAVDTIGTITSVPGNYGTSQTYSAVSSTGQFEGTGATFTVTSDGSGNIASVVKVAGGSNYEENEIITIAGNLIGGSTPTHDITFPVTAITNTVAARSRLDVLSQDYVTQLDSKEFISLDANASEAAWKINRGWNAGTSSYLTVFDSTATFMELDDCRVEGGELASFPSTATIIQFDKTAYKGAKTLITIESDDNKVHMLEVTSVCASNGTAAHATVTNSITSDNNLMDATISVVGNNVNISLNKSSAASSSSNFTGRFTTTKVKV